MRTGQCGCQIEIIRKRVKWPRHVQKITSKQRKRNMSKRLIFAYSGPAYGLTGEVLTAALREQNASLEETNKKLGELFDTKFVGTLIYAVLNMGTHNHKRAQSAMRHLLRPKQ